MSAKEGENGCFFWMPVKPCWGALRLLEPGQGTFTHEGA
jgi:hypothetical protein